MKFRKLIDKFKKLIDSHEQGGHITAEKLEKLQQLLTDKKSRYESRLETTKDPGKRTQLETRMKVVNAQLEKSKNLPTNS